VATENVQLSTWLPPEDAEAIRELARREHRSVSQMIYLLLIERLRREQEAGRVG